MKKLFNLKSGESRFYLIFTGLTVSLVLLGFSNTYLPKLMTENYTLPTIIHYHAFLFFCWLILFSAQVFFVQIRRTDLHMKIGKASFLLVPAMLIVGALTSIDAARTGHLGIPGVMFSNWHSFLFLNLAALFIFIFLFSLAILLKNKIQWHKRLMLMTTLGGLGPPGFSRLPLIGGSETAIAIVTGVLILSAPALDFKIHKRLHPAYFVSTPLILLILPPVVNAIGKSATWIYFAEFIVRSL